MGNFINKNANLLLLLLIVISAVGLVGATVYFQSNFERINAQYSEKLTQLNKVNAELNTQTELLNKLKSEYELKQVREQEIGDKYTEVKSENLDLSAQKDALTLLNTKMSGQLAEAQKQQKQAEDALQGVKDQLSAATTAKDACESDKAALQTERNSLFSVKNDCCNNCGSTNGVVGC